MNPRRTLAGLVIGAVLALAGRPAFADAPLGAFDYPLHDANDGGATQPRSGVIRLEEGARYQVTVKGTFSLWNESAWSGSPSSCPPGAAAGGPPVGVDAEYVFARPARGGDCDSGAYPMHVPNLEFSNDGGETWRHLEPVAAGYSPDHAYEYRVTGRGVPLQVRFRDSQSSDNYGTLRIELASAPGDGWAPGTWFLSAGLGVAAIAVVFTSAQVGRASRAWGRGAARQPEEVVSASEREWRPRLMPRAGRFASGGRPPVPVKPGRQAG